MSYSTQWHESSLLWKDRYAHLHKEASLPSTLEVCANGLKYLSACVCRFDFFMSPNHDTGAVVFTSRALYTGPLAVHNQFVCAGGIAHGVPLHHPGARDQKRFYQVPWFFGEAPKTYSSAHNIFIMESVGEAWEGGLR